MTDDSDVMFRCVRFDIDSRQVLSSNNLLLEGLKKKSSDQVTDFQINLIMCDLINVAGIW